MPTTGLNEVFKIDIARNDLAIIADQAQEQVALHEQATRAGNEVVQALTRMDVPNRDALIELKKQQEPGNEPETPRTPSSLARELVKPKGDTQVGVTAKDIKSDVLSVLHPDRRVDSGGSDEVDVFKSITEAQQNEDETLTQGLYAGTVASRAAVVESPSAKTLEIARYKAWIALQAGKGRFETREEIEVWKKRELAVLPYKVRAGLLGTASEIFTQALGADEKGSISLPNECYQPVSQGLEATQRVLKKILGDEAEPDDLLKADLSRFDDKLAGIIDQLKTLVEDRSIAGIGWSYFKIAMATRIGRELSAAARVLEAEGYDYARDLGSLVLSGLGKNLFGEDRFGGEEPRRIFDDKRIINSMRHEENLSNEKYYYNENDKY